MMMWMLRRKTDPKTRKHTLRETAQSKCTWPFDKSHFVWKFTGKMPDPNPGDIVSCEPAQSKTICTFEKSRVLHGNLPEKCRTPIPGTSFCTSVRGRNAHGHLRRAILWKFRRKMPYSNPAASISCEPAQSSKPTWTFPNNHFVWKFTGKMLDAAETTSIKHRALTVTVRTPQCGHTV